MLFFMCFSPQSINIVSISVHSVYCETISLNAKCISPLLLSFNHYYLSCTIPPQTLQNALKYKNKVDTGTEIGMLVQSSCLEPLDFEGTKSLLGPLKCYKALSSNEGDGIRIYNNA